MAFPEGISNNINITIDVEIRKEKIDAFQEDQPLCHVEHQNLLSLLPNLQYWFDTWSQPYNGGDSSGGHRALMYDVCLEIYKKSCCFSNDVTFISQILIAKSEKMPLLFIVTFMSNISNSIIRVLENEPIVL